MQFSDITKAIHDAWTFAWPPLVLCLIAYLVARYLNHDLTLQFVSNIFNSLKDYGKQIEGVRDILEPYGLTKLVPIVFAVAVIGFLYILNAPVTVLASKLPPHLSYSPDILLSRSMSEDEKLVLVRKFPAANSFNSAYYMALKTYGKPMGENNPSFAEINYKVDNFIKFAAIISLVAAFFFVKNGSSLVGQMLKILMLLVILSPIWAINLLQLLKNQENQFYNEWNDVRVELLKDADKLLESEKDDEEKQIIERASEQRGKRWWRVTVYDPYYIDWLKYTIFPK